MTNLPESAAIIRTPLDILVGQIRPNAIRAGIQGEHQVELLYWTLIQIAGLDPQQGFDAEVVSTEQGQELRLKTDIPGYLLSNAAERLNWRFKEPHAARLKAVIPPPSNPNVSPYFISINLQKLCLDKGIGIKLLPNPANEQILHFALTEVLLNQPEMVERLQIESGTRKYSTEEQRELWKKISRQFAAPTAQMLMEMSPAEIAEKIITNARREFENVTNEPMQKFNNDIRNATFRVTHMSQIEPMTPPPILVGHIQEIAENLNAAAKLLQLTAEAPAFSSTLPEAAEHLAQVRDELLKVPSILPFLGVINFTNLLLSMQEGQLETRSQYNNAAYFGVTGMIEALSTHDLIRIGEADANVETKLIHHRRNVPLTHAERLRLEPVDRLIGDLRLEATAKDRTLPPLSLGTATVIQA